MFVKSASFILLLVTVAGCATVPMGDPKQDAALKTFTPKADIAGVYIYRNETMGAAVRIRTNGSAYLLLHRASPGQTHCHVQGREYR